MVPDFIGNHHSFLKKPQTLFGVGATYKALAAFARKAERQALELPAGCYVNYDLAIHAATSRAVVWVGAGDGEVFTAEIASHRCYEPVQKRSRHQALPGPDPARYRCSQTSADSWRARQSLHKDATIAVCGCTTTAKAATPPPLVLEIDSRLYLWPNEAVTENANMLHWATAK